MSDESGWTKAVVVGLICLVVAGLVSYNYGTGTASAEVSELKESVATAKADLESLQDDVSTLRSENTALKTTASSLSESLAEAEQAKEEVESELESVREIPGFGQFPGYGFGGFPDPNMLIGVALQEIEDEFDNIDTCLNQTYREREMDIEDWDDVNFDFDPRDPNEYEVEFEQMEIEYDNECTAEYDVTVIFDRNDVDVEFNFLTEYKS